MKGKLLLILSCFAICIISCKNQTVHNAALDDIKPTRENIPQEKSLTSEKQQDKNQITNAEKWLKTNIEANFENKVDLKKYCDKTYLQAKEYALQMGYDEANYSEKEFKKKFPQFDLNKMGVGVGYFISGQDWDKIEVTSVDFMKKGELSNQYWFKVIIEDKTYKAIYHREFLLQINDNKYLILNIIEHD